MSLINEVQIEGMKELRESVASLSKQRKVSLTEFSPVGVLIDGKSYFGLNAGNAPLPIDGTLVLNINGVPYTDKEGAVTWRPARGSRNFAWLFDEEKGGFNIVINPQDEPGAINFREDTFSITYLTEE